MNENKIDEIIDEINTTNEDGVDVIELEPEESGNGFAGKLVAILAVGAVGVIGGLLYKNREKLEQRQIKKLEKKGYVIYKSDEVEVREIEDLDEFEEEKTE